MVLRYLKQLLRLECIGSHKIVLHISGDAIKVILSEKASKLSQEKVQHIFLAGQSQKVRYMYLAFSTGLPLQG